jgi:hypothetical protein
MRRIRLVSSVAVNDKPISMSKEADVSYYRSLSQNLHQGPELNRRNANTQQQESVKHHDDNDDDDDDDDKGAYVEK